MVSNRIKKIINSIIADALYILQEMYKNKECKHNALSSVSCQIFPEYSTARNRKYMTRESEQEMRFAFVQALLKYEKERKEDEPKLYFSIETPTEDRYSFSNIASSGKSGNFDLVIHDMNLHRICLIEFKNNYPDVKTFQKDFQKLANPKENKTKNKETCEKEDSLRYFIHTVISYDNDKVSIRLKKSNDIIHTKYGSKAIPVNYFLFSLCRDKENENDSIVDELSKIINGLDHIDLCSIPLKLK